MTDEHRSSLKATGTRGHKRVRGTERAGSALVAVKVYEYCEDMAIWSEETEDQLISLIQERPALYDISEKYYSNRAVKADLWREIETKLQLSG